MELGGDVGDGDVVVKNVFRISMRCDGDCDWGLLYDSNQDGKNVDNGDEDDVDDEKEEGTKIRFKVRIERSTLLLDGGGILILLFF